MKIIITENQRRMILTESVGEEMGEIVKNSEAKVEKLVTEAKSQMGLNLQFLLTWGAGIGGVIGPVESFVRGEFNGLSEENILLIIVSVISIHFFDKHTTYFYTNNLITFISLNTSYIVTIFIS